MEEKNKNKRKSIAEWIAVFLCIAAAPVPCITLMSATKVLSEGIFVILLMALSFE